MDKKKEGAGMKRKNIALNSYRRFLMGAKYYSSPFMSLSLIISFFGGEGGGVGGRRGKVGF